MHSSSRSRRNFLNIGSKNCTPNIVRKIDFGTSPDSPDNYSHHEVVTAMETIPRHATHNLRQKSSQVTVKESKIININKDSEFSAARNLKIFDKTYPFDGNEEENFIPAGEYFGNNSPRGLQTSGYCSGSDTPSKLRDSTRRLTREKPFNTYIAYSSDNELEDWWEQPKTEYTYSESLSYRDRISPDRRVPSPNMSRKGLRGGNATSPSPPFKNSADSLTLRSRKVPRAGLAAYSDGSDEEEESHHAISLRKNRTELQTSSSHSSKNKYSAVSRTASENSTTTTFRFGLDADENSDDESPLPTYANPIVRKGTASSHVQNSGLAFLTASPDMNKSASMNCINGKQMANYRYVYSKATSGSSTISDQCGKWYQFHKRDWPVYRRLRYWRDISNEESRFLWTRTKSICTQITMTTLLWTSGLYRSLRNAVSQNSGNQISLPPGMTANRSLNRTSTILTKTTVLSRWQSTVVTHSKEVFHWYKRRRSKNPWLLGWLPLLFLLFLMPILFYYNQDREPQYSDLNLSGTKSLLSFGLSSIWQSVLFLYEILAGILVYSFYYIRLLFLTFKDACLALINWVLNTSSHLFGFFYKASSESSPSLEASDNTDDGLWTASSLSPLSMMSTFGSKAVESGRYVSSYLSETLLNCWSFAITEALSLWNGALWLVYSVWNSILWLGYSSSSAFSYLLLLLSQLSHGVVSATSEILGLPLKLFMLVPPLFKNAKESSLPQSFNDVNPSTSSTYKQSPELIEQILQDDRFLNLLHVHFRDQLTKEDLTKGSLYFALKMSVEKEIHKMRKDSLLSEDLKSISSATKEELSLLKEKHETLLNHIVELKKAIDQITLSQETTKSDSLVYLEKMSSISGNVDKLAKQVEELKGEQVAMKMHVRSCCNASVTEDQMKSHIKLLLSDLMGFDSREGEEEDLGLATTTSKLGRWMRSYFVAKEDMETRLNEHLKSVHLTASTIDSEIAAAHDQTVKQTSDLVMTEVLDRLRSKIQEEHKILKDKYLGVIEEAASSGIARMNQVELQIERSVDKNVEDRVAAILEQIFSHLRDPPGSDGSNGSFEGLIMDGLNQLVDQRLTLVLQEGRATLDGKLVVNSSGLNVSDVKEIVKKALLKYDADKTGMVDHALESGGGSIVSTRCTEGHQVHQAEVHLLGYAIYRYSTNTPRSIIQPERNPGQCYAFKGSEGSIVIQFGSPVRVTSFTVEHIPKTLTPSGSIDSAPKAFSVYGLETLEELGFHFGDFVYSDNGDPLQSFPVQHLNHTFFNYVEWKIKSNHGNMHYTCLYRFRVHGLRKEL